MGEQLEHALDTADTEVPSWDGADGEDDYEPPLNPVLMTLSTIGLFIGFVAFVAVCIPLWITGSGH